MTQTLAAHGYPRAAQETPLEYMVATFQKLGAAPTGITRLTLLFNEARYSDHPVGEGMRDEAIAALAAVRADLEVAARRDRSTLAAAAG
jgi:hypothetical protein